MSSPHFENLFTIPEATDDILWPLIQDEKDDGNLSASIQIDNDHPWPSASSQAFMDNGNGDKLDPTLALDHHQEISAVLLPPDYTIEDYARTDELDSSTFILEPNIDEGLMESILNYPIDDSLSSPPRDSDEIDLLLEENCSRQLPRTYERTRDIHSDNQKDSSLMLYQESSALAEPSNGRKGSDAKRTSSKTRTRNYRVKQGLRTENKEVQSGNGEGTTMKKQEHNAKERIRRMKLHSSYLALGALLPADSSRSKKKSAPLIIDRAVEYIPELENEIEKLTLRKNDMLSAIKNKQSTVVNDYRLQDPSVSVHEIKQGELIIQIICTQEHSFSNLLQNVEEEEGICIMSASTLQVSDNGLCYHLHIQMNEKIDGENDIASLREKVISWLC